MPFSKSPQNKGRHSSVVEIDNEMEEMEIYPDKVGQSSNVERRLHFVSSKHEFSGISEQKNVIYQQQELFLEAKSPEKEISEVVEENIRYTKILILHVAAYKNSLIHGDNILKSLLSAGLHYGSMKIFHRYLDPVGSGPVLFSVANMMKPGSFDLDTMANFTTSGLSFFMTVPNYGDAYQNFRLMLHSAQQIADALGAVVLDNERHILTPQKLDNYKSMLQSVLHNVE